MRLANLFLKRGTIATLEGQKVPKQTFTADPAKAINATSPLVVLVNRGTAGPGELVAAALLDNKRADWWARRRLARVRSRRRLSCRMARR